MAKATLDKSCVWIMTTEKQLQTIYARFHRGELFNNKEKLHSKH